MTQAPVDGEGTQAPTQGRRQRNKAAKNERIFTAARQLFAEKGYDEVTTAELAERAQVGVGTLFRYVGSKPELLVTIMNEDLDAGAASALEMADAGCDAQEAILELLRPWAGECLDHPDNVKAYQREIIFGASPQSARALDQLTGIEGVVTDILRRTRPEGSSTSDEDLPALAMSLVATLHLHIVRAVLGRTEVGELPDRIRASLTYLLRDF